eukprot:TRINITY_DN8129_c0_g1_i1.p1 TRINITY_DN8129_c0_g1~~TRINITY_DN8129_c0_g1_i1.p1  ORF type:complete len:373 (-),score=66.33 TRINITY_DN8129_c0_g1_i1:51-1076(-)
MEVTELSLILKTVLEKVRDGDLVLNETNETLPLIGGKIGVKESLDLLSEDNDLNDPLKWTFDEQSNSVFYYIWSVDPLFDLLSSSSQQHSEYDDRGWQEFSYNKASLYTEYSNTGIALKPYYKTLSKAISSWCRLSSCPVKFTPMYGLNEVHNDCARLKNVLDKPVNDLHDNWAKMDEGEKERAVVTILEKLKCRGVLTILGIRTTAGSVSILPPAVGLMLKTCKQQHSPLSSAPLNVAARALCKHCIRSKDGYWGSDSGRGSDFQKNDRAERIVKDILQNAVWQNIHMLPHDLPKYELRNKEGYGLRWSADGLQFRGFLETKKENGQEKGRKHKKQIKKM